VVYDVFGWTRDGLIDELGRRYGKGAFHADALFRHLYSSGTADVRSLDEFRPAPGLAKRIAEDLRVELPSIVSRQDDGGTRKFTLPTADGNRTESVVIPMDDWNTLCVSSQLGCARGCAFCQTARMGLIRNLAAAEIVVQWAVVRHVLGLPVRNLVFMGMGEPFDNFDAVLDAIDILSDPRGADIPKRRISLSTVGHVEGIERLTRLDRKQPEKAWRSLHLAVSLNAPDDALRERLMPVNRIWPLERLKAALVDAPQSKNKDALYIEYVLIPGVNDREVHADRLIEWMDGLEAKVNLIPYHPRRQSPWQAPDDDDLQRFHRRIRESGRECRTRRSRGKGIEAACGMLGGPPRAASSE